MGVAIEGRHMPGMGERQGRGTGKGDGEEQGLH